MASTPYTSRGERFRASLPSVRHWPCTAPRASQRPAWLPAFDSSAPGCSRRALDVEHRISAYLFTDLKNMSRGWIRSAFGGQSSWVIWRVGSAMNTKQLAGLLVQSGPFGRPKGGKMKPVDEK